MVKDYYAILGLTENASIDDVRQAYRKLAKKYHPDVNKAPDAHQRFCEISEAYEFITAHWSGPSATLNQAYTNRERYKEYQNTDAYEKFVREAQERARRQAKMRYEKFKKQHEAFQESGFNDIALLLTMFMRFFSLALFLVLFFTPIVLAIIVHWKNVFLIFLTWPFALGIGLNYLDNRKDYFKPGKFYYTFKKIKSLFTETHPSEQSCFYCRNLTANSRPYRLIMIILKDVRVKTEGFRQHNINYINKEITIDIPRSQKAFIVHSIIALVKILTIILSVSFLGISSTPWKFMAGIFAGGILSSLILLITQTKSNVSYIINYSLIIRMVIWMAAIFASTNFHFSPFNLVSNGLIYFAIFAIILFDSFIMQLISLVLGKYEFYPIIPQHAEFKKKLNQGYILYNDIPMVSVFYPFFKWIFG